MTAKETYGNTNNIFDLSQNKWSLSSAVLCFLLTSIKSSFAIYNSGGFDIIIPKLGRQALNVDNLVKFWLPAADFWRCQKDCLLEKDNCWSLSTVVTY